MKNMIAEMLRENYYSVQEVSAVTGSGSQIVRRLCQRGEFEGAFQFAGVWIIPKESAIRYERRKVGRPPKSDDR